MKNPDLPEFDIRTFLAEEDINWNDTDFYVSRERSFVLMPTQALRTNFFIVAICTEGSAKIRLNLEEYLVSSSTVLSVTPLHIIRVTEHSPDLNARIIFFTKSFLINNHLNAHVLDHLGFFRPNAYSALTISDQDAASLTSFFALIKEKTEQDHYPYRKEIARHLIISLLYEIDAIYQHHSIRFTGKRSRKEDLSRRFHSLVFMNYKQERSVKFYADALFVSPKYLTQVIKEVTGKTAGDTIDELIILEAKVLLKLPEFTVVKVCQMLNFPDQSFFGKYFKRITGMSPSEFREQA